MLWAQSRALLAEVAAIREISAIFAALIGVIQTNFGTLPVDKSVLSCVSGTTLLARPGLL